MKKSYWRIFSLSALMVLLLTLTVIAYTTAAAAVNLKLQHRGDEVKQLQQYLVNLGYDLTVDGVFGYQTREIIRDFQLNNGLTVDGIVGDRTWDTLEEAAEDIKYEVKRGDTLYDIARRFDTTVEVLKNKNDLRSDLIKIGHVLYINKTGIGGGDEEKLYSSIHHTVQPGDALSLLAKKYGTDVETIKLANNLKNDTIYIGDSIVIPYVSREVNKPFKLVRGALIWPVMGRISSRYGYRTHPIRGGREFHDGLDIAVPIGTEVRAAASGTVVLSGYKSGFGKTVIIDHGDGVRTLYAHNSRLLVRSGQKVKIGQVICQAGSTGLSTGSHLHFSVYYQEKSRDPLRYLP